MKVNTVETDQNELSLTLIMPALLNALGNTINNIERCCVIRVVLSLDFENIGPPCMDVRLSRHVARFNNIDRCYIIHVILLDEFYNRTSFTQPTD